MTDLEFRNVVAQALSGLLGTYKAPDGSVFPAISLGYPAEPGVSVRGLEAIVLPTPTLTPVGEFRSDGEVGVVRDRTLVLRHWGPPGTSMEPAMRRILKALPNARNPRVTPATSETVAQVTYDVYETEDI